jgi:nucleotide-binding universal stress UspA family protein
MRRRHSRIMRRILVGFDGSPQSERAVDTAFILAGSLDAELLIFSVARPPEPPTRVEVSAILEDATEHFEQAFEKLRARARESEVTLETAIAVGHPVEQIVHRAEVDRIELIILGRRGVSRFARMLVGSTSEKVLRYAHCPVLIVSA